jgi:hypothetical protein
MIETIFSWVFILASAGISVYAIILLRKLDNVMNERHDAWQCIHAKEWLKLEERLATLENEYAAEDIWESDSSDVISWEQFQSEINRLDLAMEYLETLPGTPGATGPQGATGLIGQQGPIGPQGAQGIQGVKGNEGTQGPRGDAGASGPIGPIGMLGNVGPLGPQGPQGDTGAQGAQGNIGLQGSQGIQGPQGLQGVEGTRGSSISLIDVDANLDGEVVMVVELSNGTSTEFFIPRGLQGIQGPPGEDGYDGLDGRDAIGGKDSFGEET